jgi:hypothetical protein
MKNMRYIVPAAMALIALCLGWTAFAASEESGDNPSMMFVQSAPNASLKDGKLTLMSPSTVSFSRSAMTAGRVPCHSFIRAWSNGDDSFKTNPPNAVLTAFAPNGKPMKMEVSLQNPRFEGPNLVYDANSQKGNAPEGLHEAALFMNDARLLNVYYQDVTPDGTLTGPIAPSANGG